MESLEKNRGGLTSLPLLPQNSITSIADGDYIADGNPTIWGFPTVSWFNYVHIETVQYSGGRYIKTITSTSDHSEVFKRVVSQMNDSGWKQVF